MVPPLCKVNRSPVGVDTLQLFDWNCKYKVQEDVNATDGGKHYGGGGGIRDAEKHLMWQNQHFGIFLKWKLLNSKTSKYLKDI